jgi:hypothetical protein
MSQDDVLFGYRLQLVNLAGRVGVSAACRTFGVHPSTYYVWKRRIERHGLEILRPRERRAPRMPNQLSPLVEQRIVAFALGHPGLGPARIAAELGRERWGPLRLRVGDEGDMGDPLLPGERLLEVAEGVFVEQHGVATVGVDQERAIGLGPLAARTGGEPQLRAATSASSSARGVGSLTPWSSCSSFATSPLQL